MLCLALVGHHKTHGQNYSCSADTLHQPKSFFFFFCFDPRRKAKRVTNDTVSVVSVDRQWSPHRLVGLRIGRVSPEGEGGRVPPTYTSTHPDLSNNSH